MSVVPVVDVLQECMPAYEEEITVSSKSPHNGKDDYIEGDYLGPDRPTLNYYRCFVHQHLRQTCTAVSRRTTVQLDSFDKLTTVDH